MLRALVLGQLMCDPNINSPVITVTGINISGQHLDREGCGQRRPWTEGPRGQCLGPMSRTLEGIVRGQVSREGVGSSCAWQPGRSFSLVCARLSAQGQLPRCGHLETPYPDLWFPVPKAGAYGRAWLSGCRDPGLWWGSPYL